MKLGECRLRLVSYFDQLINDLDVKVESKLSELDEDQADEVNQKRELLINNIRECQKYNLANLDKTFNADEFKSLTEAEIDNRLFRKFCFLIDPLRSLEYKNHVDKLFGHFVIVDKHISADTLAAFRDLLSCSETIREIHENSLLFEISSQSKGFSEIRVCSKLLNVDNVVISTTSERLFEFSLMELRDVFIESIKNEARVLFDRVHKMDFSFNSLTRTIPKEMNNSIKEIGRHADHVQITIYQNEYESNMFSSLRDVKIKSLVMVDFMDCIQKDVFSHLNYLEELTVITRKVCLKENTFQHLSRLKSLDIEVGTRESFSLDFLLPLVELRELVIKSVETVSHVDYKPIRLDRLKKLRLERVEVDIRFLENLESLNELKLNRVPKLIEIIKTRPPDVFRKLQKLDIRNNSIENIEENTLDKLVELETLDMSVNKIQSIKAYTFKHGNSLTSIEDDAFIGLNRLSNLSLSSNEICSIAPSAFGPLVDSIESLNLYQNKIHSIEQTCLFQLKKLKQLDLAQNLIERISCLSGLEQLEELNLEGNQISYIMKDAFSTMNPNCLRYLNLSDNKLTRIESRVFSALKQLQSLALNYNQISVLDEEAFDGLEQLVELNLCGNQLPHIQRDDFSVLKSLKELDLSNNKISDIDSLSFASLKELQKLRLAENELKSLDKELFTSLEQLIELDLSSNQLVFPAEYFPKKVQIHL